MHTYLRVFVVIVTGLIVAVGVIVRCVVLFPLIFVRNVFDAAIRGVHSVGEDLAAGRNPLRPVAVTRLHCLPLFHLHRLLYHRRSVLFHSTSGALSHLADRTKGMRCAAWSYICICVSVNVNREFTGWPRKVSLYQVSSLNRIKNRHCG